MVNLAMMFVHFLPSGVPRVFLGCLPFFGQVPDLSQSMTVHSSVILDSRATI